LIPSSGLIYSVVITILCCTLSLVNLISGFGNPVTLVVRSKITIKGTAVAP